MIGSVVHDFRSPLTAVRGYAGMLASLDLPADARHEYARLIIEECDRLGGLTDELLELTRGSRSKLELRRIALSEFFRDLKPSLEAQFMDSEISLEIHLGYRGTLHLDLDRMTRAVLNVAANARQAIFGKGSFVIRSKRAGDRAVIEFEDSGCGIPAEIRHRIFEPFFSYGKAQGIGLGMCIIQKIVEEHGGETALSSEPGVGTTVRFLLPLERSQPTASSPLVEDVHQPAGGGSSSSRSF
jgi:two-component system sensor histidine kinase AtoS